MDTISRQEVSLLLLYLESILTEHVSNSLSGQERTTKLFSHKGLKAGETAFPTIFFPVDWNPEIHEPDFYLVKDSV